MTDYSLKIGGYLSSLSEFLGYNPPPSSDESDATDITDDVSLEELLNERLPEEKRKIKKSKDESNKHPSSDKRSSDETAVQSMDNKNDKLNIVGVTDSGNELLTSSSDLLPSSEKNLSLHVDGQSVEELLENRISGVDNSLPSSPRGSDVNSNVRLKNAATNSMESDITGISTVAVGTGIMPSYCPSCESIDSEEKLCPYCKLKRKAVHFHDELNVTHTISIESGHFLTPLPKKESSKTDLSPKKPEKQKHKEDAEKGHDKKAKKSDKSTNKPHENTPHT